MTDWKAVTRGVPQGSGLSPLLFNIFVRNLPSHCTGQTGTSSFQFVDDVTNYAASVDPQQVVNKLTDYFQLTESVLCYPQLDNSAKTQLLVIKAAIPAWIFFFMDDVLDNNNCS